MADPFLAEIRVFGFNFAPTGWAHCNGQLLPISQNTALFSLLGTTYGGNGSSTFALPDIQGSCVLGPGQGPGLSLYDAGEQGGVNSLTLLEAEMPLHNHGAQATIDDAQFQAPQPDRALATSNPGFAYVNPAGAANVVTKDAATLGAAGGDLPHNNMQPYLVLNFCIALQGVFPSSGGGGGGGPGPGPQPNPDPGPGGGGSGRSGCLRAVLALIALLVILREIMRRWGR